MHRNSLDDGCMGYHACGVCTSQRREAYAAATGGEPEEDDDFDELSGLEMRDGIDKNQFFVEANRVRYVLPNMVTHYISAHRSKLPPEMEAAVLASPD